MRNVVKDRKKGRWEYEGNAQQKGENIIKPGSFISSTRRLFLALRKYSIDHRGHSKSFFEMESTTF